MAAERDDGRFSIATKHHGKLRRQYQNTAASLLSLAVPGVYLACTWLEVLMHSRPMSYGPATIRREQLGLCTNDERAELINFMRLVARKDHNATGTDSATVRSVPPGEYLGRKSRKGSS